MEALLKWQQKLYGVYLFPHFYSLLISDGPHQHHLELPRFPIFPTKFLRGDQCLQSPQYLQESLLVEQ
jgi:hypothetical protein